MKSLTYKKGYATFSITPQNMEENHETHQNNVNNILLVQ